MSREIESRLGIGEIRATSREIESRLGIRVSFLEKVEKKFI
jgi:hypothetical protein